MYLYFSIIIYTVYWYIAISIIHLDLYNYLHTYMHVLTSFFFRTLHTTGLAFACTDSMMINMSKSSIQLAFIP